MERAPFLEINQVLTKSLESLCHKWQKYNAGKTRASGRGFNFAQGFSWDTEKVEGQHWEEVILMQK